MSEVAGCPLTLTLSPIDIGHNMDSFVSGRGDKHLLHCWEMVRDEAALNSAVVSQRKFPNILPGHRRSESLVWRVVGSLVKTATF